MADIWGSIKETAKSLGGAAVAPAGVVYDLASMPFDDKDDSFGSVVHAILNRAGDTLDPVINPQTLTGGLVTKTLEGMMWAYKEGVDEPISASRTAVTHAFGTPDLSTAVLTGAAFSPQNWGEFTDADTWRRSYEIAQGQTAGESISFGTLTGATDPLAYKNPYDEVTAPRYGTGASALAVGTDLALMFGADPTWAALKVGGVVRGATQYAKLNATQKANLYSEITAGSKPGLLRQNLASRTDKYLDWIGGKNSLGRPLSGPEILYGTPELKRYATEPHAIAGLLSDANKITDPIAKRDAQRRILAVAAGDTSQIARLRMESTETASIADALNNIAREQVIDLKALGAAPTLRTDPRFMASLESQLTNLNKDGSVDKFIDGWNNRLDLLLKTDHTLPNLPGVHSEGKRAINRLNQGGVLRAPNNAAKALDDWAAKRALEAQSASTVFQKGLYSVPVVAVKTVGLAASPWTKAPVAVSDALRQTHFTGVANLHDWGGAATQLDSMMRVGRVSPGERMKLLSEAYLAKTEPEKQLIIERIEHASMQSLAGWASSRSGANISADYITKLMEEGAAKRGASLVSMRGRAYAATPMPEEMATRVASAGRVEDAAALGQSKGLSATSQGKWRLDQINDDGTPLALPLLETQLANYVPLLDIDIARKVIARDTSKLSRLSKAWEAESKELTRLAGLKAAGHKGLDGALAAKSASLDWLVQAGQQAMKLWKFSVLFRLGYPLRVLTDDHLRIYSQIGAGSFYGGNVPELMANMKFNAFDRRVQGRAALHDLKVRRQQLLDELEGDVMVSHAERRAHLAELESRITGRQKSVAALRKQVTDAETLGHANVAQLQKRLSEREGDLRSLEAGRDHLLEQLGGYGPDDLKRELESVESLIESGSKALRPNKRGIGSNDVTLGDDFSIEGAFGGEYGSVMRAATSSGGTFDNLLQGAEERGYRAASNGSHRTILAGEDGHLTAWADVLNNQFRTSPVAMHFLEGGSVNDFARWVRQPEQADLRRRLPHFAYDPEDWGQRVQGLVRDYIPTDDLRQAVLNGRVSEKTLAKMFADPVDRPAVHGRVAADNLGISAGTLGVGKAMNRIYRMLGELPTDHLSRHPFFNSLYKMHAREVYATRRAGGVTRFTPEDAQEISATARKLALKDLKSTLFDLSAHSHAAHVMRFISPFFGAHQEGVARWWRIAADNPQVVRRFTQVFDVPRVLGIEVDENGDLVEPGAPISRNHRILLQLPQAFGGPDPTEVQAKWSINENAFNIVLQGGLTNPGTGPLVTVPMEWAAKTYADDPKVARVARVFNPYPPQSPLEAAIPATFKRLSGGVYGATGVDIGFGIGQREYNAAFSQNVQDLMVDFQLKHGREPNAKEASELVDRAGTESTIQMFHRALWNGLSPAPASPRSKYSVIQQGWYKIQEQARAEGQDFDWAYARFKEKYGEAYMPLVYSTSNNPAWVDANSADVAAIKHYKGILKNVDPALTRVVIGAYATDMIEKDATLGEYSPEASNYLRTTQIRPGDSQTYYSYDEPRAAAEEQMARRGWQKYGELTASLTAQAQRMGLDSYEESDQLVAVKRQAVEVLKAENYAWAKDYDTVDSGQYDRYLDGLRQIVESPVLANDTERTDIKTLGLYLKLRDFFSAVFEARQAAGLGGYEAQAQDQVRQVYTSLVGRLVESNTYFEEYAYNGLVERDPYLVKEAA